MKYIVPKLIIGNSIEALLYAWRTETKIVSPSPGYVFRHDKLLVDYDFSFINAENPKQLYSNLIFVLSLNSLLLFQGNISSVREEPGEVVIITKGNRKITIIAEEVIHFDKKMSSHNVYDFFDVREMSSHNKKQIVDPDSNFVHQIDFYNSPRTAQSTHNDLVASSRMTSDDLLDPNLGQGIVKIKIARMLKSAGIEGKFAWQRKEKRYYKKPKIVFYKRVIAPTVETTMTFKDIYNLEQSKGRPWKMLETMRKKEGTSLGSYL